MVSKALLSPGPCLKHAARCLPHPPYTLVSTESSRETAPWHCPLPALALGTWGSTRRWAEGEPASQQAECNRQSELAGGGRDSHRCTWEMETASCLVTTVFFLKHLPPHTAASHSTDENHCSRMGLFQVVFNWMKIFLPDLVYLCPQIVHWVTPNVVGLECSRKGESSCFPGHLPWF